MTEEIVWADYKHRINQLYEEENNLIDECIAGFGEDRRRHAEVFESLERNNKDKNFLYSLKISD